MINVSFYRTVSYQDLLKYKLTYHMKISCFVHFLKDKKPKDKFILAVNKHVFLQIRCFISRVTQN